MKEHRCTMCNKVYASSQSLWNHKQKCKENHSLQRPSEVPFPNALQNSIIPTQSPSGLQVSEVRPLLQTPYDSEDERLNYLEVRNGEIDGIIDRSVEWLKDEIWNYMSECHEFDENERKGGTIASWDTLNRGDEQKKDEEVISNEESEDEEEVIFLDVIKKDVEKLGELLNELSQHSKFTDKTAKINTLMDSYLNKYNNFIPIFGRRRTKTTLEDVHDILQFLGRERETVGLVSKIHLLINKIENIRQLINRLFWIMKIKNEKQKKNELSRLTLNAATEQEVKTFENELTPESVSRVLKARKE